MKTAELVKKYNHIFHTDYCADANCQAAWLFTEGSGTTVDDSSSNNNVGTFKGTGEPAWSTDVPGVFAAGSVSFDGVDDVITNTTLDLGAASVSQVFWVNLDSTSEQGAFVNVGSPGDATYNGWGVGVGNPNMQDSGRNGNFTSMLYNGVRWIDNYDNIGTGWHHLAFLVNASGYPELYLDGVSVYSDTTGAPNNPSARIDFGGYLTPSTDRFPDFIGTELAFFNDILTSTEINDIMDNGLKPATGGAVTLIQNAILQGVTIG